ncbi:MAG: hypothetical protein IPM18_07905 [Phycisphaerales bacterium]|nr:hypothetical protein [Phycisphaerales bacterium]
MERFFQALVRLDRRWIFLLMGVAVMIPIIAKMEFEEQPTKITQDVFDLIESLPAGSRVLLPFDYDPGSKPELQPMATALAWHCARKGHKLYFLALWPLGPEMIEETIETVLKRDFPHYRYGIDYVNLGFKPGDEGVIKVVVSNLPSLFPTDHRGRSLSRMEMTRDLVNIRSMDAIVNVSAGYPGTKEWVQYAATPYGLKIVAGCTGVQSPLMYPYIPDPLVGLLGAIKGAAEYEAALAAAYPEYWADPEGTGSRADFRQGVRRMGPQLIAHCVILLLIILGNVALFVHRKERAGVRA